MSKNRIAPLAAVVAALAFAGPSPVRAACDCSVLPTLGSAANIPAMGLGDILVHLQGNTIGNTLDVPGNVGVTGSGGTVHLQGNALIQGTVHHETGSTVQCTPAASCVTKILGGTNERDMSAEHADLITAHNAFAAMGATQNFGNLNTDTVIGGNGCINVIDIDGHIDLDGNEKITLSGSSDDYFVINVHGDMLTDGTADIVLDGLEPNQVIFNLIGAGRDVELGGNSGGNFTILNPYGSVYLHGNSGGRGAYYAGQTKLHFQGAVDFYGQPFACSNTSCPDPELTGANIQTPATPQGRSIGNSSFFYAWFDLGTYEGHLEHYRLDAAGTIRDEQGADPIDVNNEFGASRDPYWDAAIPLRSNTSRKLFTTLTGAQTVFNKANIHQDDLNLQDGEISAYPNSATSGIDTKGKLRDAIVDFLHGIDAFDQDGDGSQTDLRDAVLGDIFHSNPLFIGDPTNLMRHEDGFEGFYTAHKERDRVVYAGANDGIFHAFHAGDYYDPNNPSVFSGGTGAELFGYVPGLLLPSVKLVPRTDDTTGARLAPSFVDGNIVAADAWLGDGSGTDISKSPSEWATVLIAAFREGGRGYLALDVSDPDATAASPHFPYPSLLWEFADTLMAESWSRPVITRVKLAGAGGTGDHCGLDNGDGDCREQWVAIFGAGYQQTSDPNYIDFESDSTSTAWVEEGKALYMVALDSGQILAQLRFDSTGAEGSPELKYAFPAQPAVIDLDGDKFADIVLAGDLGGQLWKWDLSNKGVDSDADPLIDNWNYGRFFAAAPENMGVVDGRTIYHYKSMFSPASAAYVNGSLTYVFGTGERRDLLYAGDAALDENNRLYVIKDPNPIGASSIPATPYSESNLTDVTALAVDNDATDMGYFIVAEDAEKFITDVLVFAGYAIAASYAPDAFPGCGPGKAYLYTLKLSNGLGYFDAATPDPEDRRMLIGTGIPSTPRISVSPNPADDIGFINTSDKKVLSFEPPLRDPPESSMIYWKQQF